MNKPGSTNSQMKRKSRVVEEHTDDIDFDNSDSESEDTKIRNSEAFKRFKAKYEAFQKLRKEKPFECDVADCSFRTCLLYTSPSPRDRG